MASGQERYVPGGAALSRNNMAFAHVCWSNSHEFCLKTVPGTSQWTMPLVLEKLVPSQVPFNGGMFGFIFALDALRQAPSRRNKRPHGSARQW